jgi:hypothetical protein
MKKLLLAVTLLIGACSQPESASVEVLVGGTLIDGKGGAPLEYPVIVIEGGKVIDAGPQTHVRIPQGSRKVDTTGLTIRPSKPGGRIEPGAAADLELVAADGSVSRRMAEGRWQ